MERFRYDYASRVYGRIVPRNFQEAIRAYGSTVTGELPFYWRRIGVLSVAAQRGALDATERDRRLQQMSQGVARERYDHISYQAENRMATKVRTEHNKATEHAQEQVNKLLNYTQKGEKEITKI